jgi:uncharacterized protein
MKKIIISVFLLGLTLCTIAQTNSKNEKIKQMLELTGSAKLGVQIAKQVISSFREKYNYVEPAFWTSLEAEIKPDDLTNMVIPIYAKYYSEDEIDQIIAFYNSPVGKKMIEITPSILQESMSSGKNWGQEISERVNKSLREKGYIHE